MRNFAYKYTKNVAIFVKEFIRIDKFTIIILNKCY